MPARTRARKLLAVTRYDEQAVVDRQSQAEGDHEIEGEDRERDRLVHQPEPQKGAKDRESAHEERQQRSHEPPEEEEGEHEEDREGDRLGLADVLADLIADRGPRQHAAAERDPGDALEP